MKSVISFILILMMIAPLASAGILWNEESKLVPENTKTCLTYSVYNPFDSDAYYQVKLIGELADIIVSSESETKFVPAGTFHDDALPIEFCFKTPRVYEQDCLVGGFICKQTCEEPMKVYEGQVEVIKLSEEETKIGEGSGGSTTQISEVAPSRVRVQCTPSDRNYGSVYALIALIAGILLWINIVNTKKPKKKTKKKLHLKK